MILINLKKGKPDLSAVPQHPGVYLYRDGSGQIIYIGKAKNVLKRVRSYFTAIDHQPLKTKLLVSHIQTIDWIVVNSEVEALLLENQLIKKHKPKYNIDLKDGKTYAYIKLTSDPYPRILSTRKVTKDGVYFGPYTDGFERVQLLRTAVSIFKVRTCRTLPKHACLNYHIGLCTAPCIANVTSEEYSKQVKDAKAFLKGDVSETKSKLTSEMQEFSKALKFELALERKQQLSAMDAIFEKQKVERVESFDQDVFAFVRHNDAVIIELFTIERGVIKGKSEYRLDDTFDVFSEFLRRYYATRKIPRELILNVPCFETDEEKEALETYFSTLRNGAVSITVPERGDKFALVKLAEKNATLNLEENAALREVQDALNLPEYPKIVEFFDISNLGAMHLVAGMTRFIDGKPDLSGYRKFKIKSVEGKNDDFASMVEVIHRRYRRLTSEKSQFPDLIVVDGGAGQVASGMSALRALGLKIPLIGLAKEDEEIYTPSESAPKKFNANSKMMLLLREMRDRTHQFAIGYNRKRRQMQMREEFKEIQNKS